MKIGRFEIGDALTIVSVGALSNPDVVEGRLIPVLVVDCSERRDIVEMVNVHRETLTGDVTVQWFRHAMSDKIVYLKLSMIKPMEISCLFAFNVSEHGGNVDLIVRARCMYLQPNELGPKTSDNYESPRILVEIPSVTKLDNWDATYRKSIIARFRADGYSKPEAGAAASQYLAYMRDVTGRLRVRSERSQHQAPGDMIPPPKAANATEEEHKSSRSDWRWTRRVNCEDFSFLRSSPRP